MNRFAVLSVLLLASCQIIFVEDSIDPRLPRYTEVGANIAGAIYNGDDVWRIASGWYSGASFEVDPARDSIAFVLPGYLLSDNSDLAAIFCWKTDAVKTFNDLASLNGEVISSASSLFLRTHVPRDTPCSINAESQLIFQQIKWMPEESVFYVSGTFGLRTTEPCNGVKSLESGRFDFKIGESGVSIAQ